MVIREICPECNNLLGGGFHCDCRTCRDYIENAGVPWSKLWPDIPAANAEGMYNEITLCCIQFTAYAIFVPLATIIRKYFS